MTDDEGFRVDGRVVNGEVRLSVTPTVELLANLRRLRLSARRNTVFTIIIAGIVVLSLGLAHGTYHVPWWLSAIDALMIGGVVASAWMSGAIAGRYWMLLHITRSIQVDLEQVGGKEDEGDDSEIRRP